MHAQHFLAAALAVLHSSSALAGDVSKKACPTLVVQVVDKGWVPIPGLAVVVTAQGAGGAVKGATEWSATATTDPQGYANFSPKPRGEYQVVVPKQAGLKEHGIRIKLYPGPEDCTTAYVQLRITELEGYVPLE